jgi:hypothetical protein
MCRNPVDVCRNADSDNVDSNRNKALEWSKPEEMTKPEPSQKMMFRGTRSRKLNSKQDAVLKDLCDMFKRDMKQTPSAIRAQRVVSCSIRGREIRAITRRRTDVRILDI